MVPIFFFSKNVIILDDDNRILMSTGFHIFMQVSLCGTQSMIVHIAYIPHINYVY